MTPTRMQASSSRRVARDLFRATMLIVVAVLGGCVTAAVGTATVIGVDIVHDRRTLGSFVDDNTVEVKIRTAIQRDGELRKHTHLSATSMNGVVLLSGEAPTKALRDRAVALVRSFKEVRQIVDELRIAGETTLMSRLNDSWLTTKVKTRLFGRTRLDATRVKVVSEHGSVFLMGLVTREEGGQAAQITRSIKGVSRVVKVFEYTNG